MRIYAVFTTAVLGLISVTGCGFLFVNGPPNDHEQLDYFTCTESMVGPTLDWVWFGLQAAGLLAYASDPDGYNVSNEALVGAAAYMIVSPAAALTGTRKVNRCREAKEALAIRASSPTQVPVQADRSPEGQVLPPPLTDIRTEPERRPEAQYSVPPESRAARTYIGGTGDDAVQAVLRGMTDIGFHTTPTDEDHACFAGFDGVQGDLSVTTYVCEAEDPISEDLRWEITIVSRVEAVVVDVRRAIEEAAG